MTPTIHREGPFRFFFYSHEPREPPHVHVEHDDAIAKLWLHDASVADPGGCATGSSHEHFDEP